MLKKPSLSWPRFSVAPRIRLGMQSLALAVLMGGITVLAVKVFGWRWPGRVRHAVAVVQAPRRGYDLSHDQRLIAVRPELDTRAAASSPSQGALTQEGARKMSAAEMFAAADRARTHGDIAEAIRWSRQIEEFFPNSEQGVDTHLVLGLLYLERAQPELALQEFATFRHIGPPEAKAEALFGQARALRTLGRAEDERIVLAELLQSYPRSAYVAAARLRMSELDSASDAGRP